MKKRLRLVSVLASLVVMVSPLSALAVERIAATFQNGNVYIKDGGLTSPWHQVTSGVVVTSLGLAGDRITIVDGNASSSEVAIKEPGWDSPWEWVAWGQPANQFATTSQLSNGAMRLLVLRNDGTVVMKDGPWNTGWWSGTLTPPSGTVSQILAGGDLIGEIMSNGNFYAKQLTPGQFSHPNNTPWQLVATNVLAAALNNNIIAYQDNSTGNVYAKEGGVTAPWAGNHAVIYNNLLHSGDLRVGGNRLCVVKANHNIECKQGGLTGQSILTWIGGVSMDVSSTRVAVRLTDLTNSAVLEGSLNGPNSGWQTISSNGVIQIDLNNK